MADLALIEYCILMTATDMFELSQKLLISELIHGVKPLTCISLLTGITTRGRFWSG